VRAGRGLLGLAPGRRILLNAVEWTVESVEPQLGRFVLAHTDGRVETRSIRWLVNHPDARISKETEASGPGQGTQPRTPADLTAEQQRRARIRAEHVLESLTGFRSGHPSRARPGEPRPAYDPARTTLTERRLVKVAELKAMPPQEAEMLGLRFMSLRTLERLSSATGESLLLACADGRWTRRRSGHWRITEEVRKAIFAVRSETKDRARIGMASKHRLLHQYMAETFPEYPTDKIPSRVTLWRVWHEWFGPEGGRQRYQRSAAQAEEAGVAGRVVVHRPGQVLALDSTPLPVKLRETVFGDAVTATLTLALDLYSHTLPAFRLTLASDTSVDVAMLLRDVMLPLPMREGWGEEMQWPYPGIPADVIAEFTGHTVAALPFFAPETVTTDHGSPYKNHDLVEAERALGCNILPARTLRASDKFAAERAFSSVKTLLFEHLLGFTGTDVADRGADPEGDAVFTLTRMEHLIATWIVQVWQNRKLGEYAPSWGPGEDHSPNSLFAAAMLQGGFALQIPEPELYYEVLRKHHVKIHPRRGVKILGLWYHADVLDEPRYQLPSDRGGKHTGKWVVRSDRRDRRQVFFQDPVVHDTWHVLRWNGLPPQDEVPAFSDMTAAHLLDKVKEHKLGPLSDQDLLPVLLEILGSATPVAQWPTQSQKRERTARSRESSRAQAAAADRDGHQAAEPAAWPEQTRTVAKAVDASRRRLREASELGEPVAPPLLVDSLRHRSLFLLPDPSDEDDHDRSENG
jgi:hypothetical protein